MCKISYYIVLTVLSYETKKKFCWQIPLIVELNTAQERRMNQFSTAEERRMNQFITAGFEATKIRYKFGRILAKLCDVGARLIQTSPHSSAELIFFFKIC